MKSQRVFSLAMVVLLFALIFIPSISSTIYAAETTPVLSLAWDANDPLPDGYRLFQRKAGQSYDYSNPIMTFGAEDTSAKVLNLEIGTLYYFVLRAFAGDMESGDSNEVGYTPQGPVEPPKVYPKRPTIRVMVDVQVTTP
jgi:hypothetical protein